MSPYIIPGLPEKEVQKRSLVFSIVCGYFLVSRENILSNNRKREIVTARHTLMYLLRKDCGMTWKGIGMYLGGRDHTTAIHGVNTLLGYIFIRDSVTIENVRNIRDIIKRSTS